MTELFNFPCPEDLKRQIEEQAIATGENPAQIVIAILRQAFGLDRVEAAIVGHPTFQLVQARLDYLEKKCLSTIPSAPS